MRVSAATGGRFRGVHGLKTKSGSEIAGSRGLLVGTRLEVCRSFKHLSCVLFACACDQNTRAYDREHPGATWRCKCDLATLNMN